MKTYEMLLEVSTIVRESTTIRELDLGLAALLRRAYESDRKLFPIYVCFLAQLKDVIGSMLLADKPHLYGEYSKPLERELVATVFLDTLNCPLPADGDPFTVLLDLLDKHVGTDGCPFHLCISNYQAMIVTVFRKEKEG